MFDQPVLQYLFVGKLKKDEAPKGTLRQQLHDETSVMNFLAQREKLVHVFNEKGVKQENDIN